MPELNLQAAKACLALLDLEADDYDLLYCDCPRSITEEADYRFDALL